MYPTTSVLKQVRKPALTNVLATCVLLATLSSDAGAEQYEVFVDINNEEDLYDLQVQNLVDDNTLANLVELLQRGVDLNRASRKTLYALPNLSYAEVDAILAYRDEAGSIIDPSTLVTHGILSSEKLQAIAAFLLLRTGGEDSLPISGVARMQSRIATKDTGAPASALKLRVQGMGNLKAGLVAHNTRQQIGRVRYDPARNALSASAAKDELHLPKLYVHWESEKWSAIAGTYRTGFGQRLTFDNTNQTDPDGFYGDAEVFRGINLTRDCKESTGELGAAPCPSEKTYVSPDYRSRDGLLGAAVSVKELKVGSGTVSAQAFTSYQPRSIYQYELFDSAICDDPRADNEACKAPRVFRTQEMPLDRSSYFSFQTLPNVYAEQIVGANVNYSFGRRAHIGVTGYSAQVDWLVEGIELDFQEWSSLPFGGGFGAVGIDGAKGFGNTDVFFELTRTFDGMPSGGGMGGIVRAVSAWDKNEVETSVRYYDKNFANPHARPIAAADEFEGLRARDEMGIRVKYTGEFDKRFRVRSKIDFWRTPSLKINEISAFVRGDIKSSDQITWGLWTQYQDRDLARSGREQCYEVASDLQIGEFGFVPLGCGGQKLQLTGRLKVTMDKNLWFDLQYQHEVQDDAKFDESYRQDIGLVGIVTAKPSKKLRIRARTRYLFEAITDSTFLENTWWTYVDLSYRVRKRDNLKLRYDLVVRLDDRASTLARSPNPEHWFRVEYEARF